MQQPHTKGRQPDRALHEKIYQLRVVNKLSIRDTAKQWQQEQPVTSTSTEDMSKP